MYNLINNILDQLPHDVLTDTELFCLIPGSDAAKYNLLKRAVQKGDLVRARRGLYYLPKRFQRQGLHTFALAQRIYGPSYISFESALSYHGLIPEAVYDTTSASVKRGREFRTPAGLFSYSQVPIRAFMTSVSRVEEGPHVFLIASPLKAICDLVHFRKLDWSGIEPLVESLRIERDSLKFSRREIKELKAAYASSRITRFLDGIEKERP